MSFTANIITEELGYQIGQKFYIGCGKHKFKTGDLIDYIADIQPDYKFRCEVVKAENNYIELKILKVEMK